MSATKRKVEGFDYLYLRGRSYEVRLQVPKALRVHVGKGELKRSLGGDFAKARRVYHTTVSEFQQIVENARQQEAPQPLPLARPVQELPTHDEINAASYAHFRVRMENMRGKNMSPSGRQARSRAERINALHEMLAFQLDTAEAELWSTMSGEATWLCTDMGWRIPADSDEFDYLSQSMMRARIQALKNELRRLEGQFGADPDADPLFGQKPPEPMPQKVNLGDLVKRFQSARQHKWSGSTQKNYAIIFRVIEEICGKATTLDRIDHDYCVEVWQTLKKLPANFQKHPDTRGKPIAEAIEIAARAGHPTISPATINGHLNKFAALIRFGRDKGWIVGNPMEDIEEPDPVPAREKRDAFTTEQLNLIFGSAPWSDGPDAEPERPSRYWAPLIALFSGARLSEICGQRVDEMIDERDVKAFHFRLRPDDRSIKSGESRKVPVHPVLIELGFWDFVEAARKSGREMLFPDVKRDRLGKWGDSTSKWFARLVDKLELRGRLLSFHSLRHTFEDALREADLHNTAIGNELTGRWTSGVSKDYGSSFPLSKLSKAIAKVSYPGLVLPSVRPAA
ncbi:integrase [Novosphingobium indicum]|uniref:Integrase n=1 Tax=Novosphingobium indicum TaxID=462949 RepID=A0ABQ2JPV7_9SPHN|nr:site-specific integrase [Novosphingobium indicum]GGN51413.1 integrase [Novosphingobium indicum]